MRRWLLVCILAGVTLLATCFSAIAGAGQARDYHSELAAARQEVISTGGITIRKLDLGEVHPGKNRFEASVKNPTDHVVTLGLDLRADPGFWTHKWQNEFLFLLWPDQEQSVTADYEFDRLSPAAWVRIRFFFPQVTAGGVTEIPAPFFEKKYYVGDGNPADDCVPMQLFTERRTEHFHIYFMPSSLAARDIEAIVRQRESAFQKISAMVGTTYSGPIRIVFFPDSETKTRETGHTGSGWAFENNIAEVYNEKTQLDPFHELTHILAGRLGDPPAMFNEGFAVYASELLGADALKELGSPGKRVDEAVAADQSDGKLIHVDKLFAFTDIGPDESQPIISYPEAASFVKFLITKYGLEKFRLAFKSLKNSDRSDVVRKNEQTFREIYGKLPTELEPEWLGRLTSSKR